MDSPKVLRNILTNIFPKCLTAKIILIVTIKIVTRRIFNRLINKKIISLDRLVRMRFSLGKLLIEKIDALIDEACKKNMQAVLFGNEVPKVRVQKDRADRSKYFGRAKKISGRDLSKQIYEFFT